jgi:hypothetical protein
MSTSSLDVEEIVARLHRVERANAIWRAAAVGLFLLAAVASLAGAQARPDDTITTKAVGIVGLDGKLSAVVLPNSIGIGDPVNSRSQAVLGKSLGGEGYLLIGDGDGDGFNYNIAELNANRGTKQSPDSGFSRLRLWKPYKHKPTTGHSVSLSTESFGDGPGLYIKTSKATQNLFGFKEDRQVMLRMETDGAGEPTRSVLELSHDGRPGVRLVADSNGGKLEIYDKAGNVIFSKP